MDSTVLATRPARVFVTGEPRNALAAAEFGAIRSAGGEPVTQHRVMALAPKAFVASRQMGKALRSGELDPQTSELVALRTCQLENGYYELAAHRHLARAIGLTDEHLAALENWQEASIFTEAQRAMLAYVDAMAAREDVGDDVFEALRPHFSDREIVEISILSGMFAAMARLANGINIQLEPESVWEKALAGHKR